MSDWKPPIAYVPGHLPSCLNSCGDYRSCVDKTCPAHLAWDNVDVRGRAFADHDRDERERALPTGRPDSNG